jgi:hypothetical protein
MTRSDVEPFLAVITIRERLDSVSEWTRSFAACTMATAPGADASWAKTDPAQSAIDKTNKTNLFILKLL